MPSVLYSGGIVQSTPDRNAYREYSDTVVDIGLHATKLITYNSHVHILLYRAFGFLTDTATGREYLISRSTYDNIIEVQVLVKYLYS